LVLFGAGYTTAKPRTEGKLEERETLVLERISLYKKTAAAEGGITGAGGILLAFADFPLLLGIKIKLLFDIAALYGFNVEDYRERVYILYIFQLAFSSQEKRKEIYLHMNNWKHQSALLPEDIHQFDWRSFQQEYRDYIHRINNEGTICRILSGCVREFLNGIESNIIQYSLPFAHLRCGPVTVYSAYSNFSIF